ncbi:MAG: exodeoxyribonuclease V subunit beta [Rhodoferax sp.]
MSPPVARWDVMQLPLQGWQLIEASAGTGKTWTLAALVVRLVLERGLYPPQCLVMTYTEAATEELRGRIRARLADAARFFAASVREPQTPTADTFLDRLRSAQPPERWANCAQALDLAAQWMDEAAIYTLHGWAARMLKRFAFDSASLFEREPVSDSQALQLQAAQDYWRRWIYRWPTSALGLLGRAVATPAALLAQIGPVWMQADRSPQAMAQLQQPVADPLPLVHAWCAWRRTLDGVLQQLCARWTPALVQALRDAQAARRIKGWSASQLESRLGKMADWMADWRAGGGVPAELFGRFSAQALVGLGWIEATHWPALADIDQALQLQAQEPPARQAVLAHAAHTVWMDYQAAKSRRAQFDFSDLLQQLYHACAASQGRLARAIAQQYPVALVDEFQDTDPWQYGTLEMIYGPLAQDPAHGLILIGDPKQAIYGFRGADLATYLRARSAVNAIHTLQDNWRSSAALVRAVNHCFERAHRPFDDLPYVPVAACNPKVQALEGPDGKPLPAMTVWHTALDEPLSGGAYRQTMAEVFASQMVALLQQGLARPGEMAVLVRDRHDAAAIRQALARRGVRSVYLSERDSVYASAQAQDLWHVLCAVANPADARRVRSALCCPSWGLAAAELHALCQDEARWEAQVDQFVQWQRVWRTQGVLPMLLQLLHQSGMAQRLLAQGAQAESGERQLTNWLHLAELLQAASAGLRTPTALIRHQAQQLRHPGAGGDVAQLRLESDAQLVQVVTLHKAKGLQYPLVFMPFACSFKVDRNDPEADAQRVAEDLRLLYVGLTRAERALWLGVAPLKGETRDDGTCLSALGRLLGLDRATDWPTALAAWQACPDIVVAAAPHPSAVIWQPDVPAVSWRAPLQPRRRWLQPRWSASFTALTRGLSSAQGLGPTSLDDEREREADLEAIPLASEEGDQAQPETPPQGLQTPLRLAMEQLPAGSRWGSLLHQALQHQTELGWPVAAAPAPPTPAPAWLGNLRAQCLALGLDEAGQAALVHWLRAIAHTRLPLASEMTEPAGPALHTLGRTRCWPEMAFTLGVRTLSSAQLDAHIQRSIWPGMARAGLTDCVLNGLLTGFIDLVFEHGGRYWVLDYKSNRLPSYDPQVLQAAALQHRYEVQAVLYQLALHRLLRGRLPDYDPARHLGDALIWFVRGLDQPGCGVLRMGADPQLVQTLDAALSDTVAR